MSCQRCYPVDTLDYLTTAGWAKTHLEGAGLIESPARAQYRITQRGLDALSQEELPINLAYLKRFEEYKEFQSGPKSEKKMKSKAQLMI